MSEHRKFYLSASSVRTFQQCKLKFYYNYVKHIPSSYSDILVQGIAVHRSLEYMYKKMAGLNRYPNEDEVADIKHICLETLAEKGIDTISVIESSLELVESAISKYNPLEKIIDLERSFKIFTTEGIPLAGSIDKLVELHKDTIGVFDYKTSFIASTQDELDSDIQLSMYDLAVSFLYPQYTKVVLILDYLRHDQVATTRTEEQRKIFSEFLLEVYKRMTNLTEDNATPELNKYCSWCDYKELCPKYSSLSDIMVMDAKPVSGLSDKELVNEWDKLKLSKKLIESKMDELKMHIVEGMKVSGKRSLDGEDSNLYITQTAKSNYNVKDLFSIIPTEDLLDLVSVNTKRLNDYLKVKGEFKQEIEKISTKSFSSPILRKGK